MKFKSILKSEPKLPTNKDLGFSVNNKSTENEDFNDGFLNNFKKHHNATLNITNELNKKNKGDLSLTIYVSTSYFNYTEANQLIRKQLKKNNRFV